ncbi:MAG TPA: hypothetical protein DF383_07455 [Deltaproteobacteria bacterium]|nr:hypothetical protein [Deltaproteobacteria bacterium]
MQFLKNLWNRIPWASLGHSLAVSFVFFCILVGILLVPLGLPGTWVIVAGSLLYSFFDSFDGGATSPWRVNAILIGLAAFGEIVEFAVGTLGGKPFRVSNGAIVSAFFGGIVGGIIGVPVFLIGALLGIFLGAFLGALFYEWITLKTFSRAFVNAMAVLASRIVATFLKASLAVGMGVYLAFKIF